MKFSKEVLDKTNKYQTVGYMCESFEHLPIALVLIQRFPNIKIFSTSDHIIDYLKKIGINGSKINLTDINPVTNLLHFIAAIFRLRAESNKVIKVLKDHYIFTSSARVSISLFYVFDRRRNDTAFIGWDGIDWHIGRRLSGKPNFLSWKSYLILKVRRLLYWALISSKIELREFSGETFLTYVGGFDYFFEIEEKEKWIKHFVEINHITKINQRKKAYFLLGYSYFNDAIAFGKERVDALFSLLKKYRNYVCLKVHPGSSRDQYFGSCNDIFLDCYDEDIPIEVLATSADLLISFGSSGLINASKLGINCLCVGRVGKFPAGNLGDNYYQNFSTADSNYYKELRTMEELNSFLNSFSNSID